MSDADVSRYWGQLQDESFMILVDMLGLDLPNPRLVRAPVLVLGAGRDAIIRPSEIEATARAYRTRAVVFPDLVHDLMLGRGTETVAAAIRAWLDELSRSGGPRETP